MTDFIREVDEEVRQDRFKRALDRYWYVVAAAVVLILGGVGAWKAWEYVRTQRAEAASGQYLAALDLARDGKSEDAMAALKSLVAKSTPGYQMLARFRLAGETGVKDPAAAARMFDDLAADPAVDPAMQAVARLRAGLLLVDTLPYGELKTRLDPLADANSPLRNAAREMLALAALKANAPQDAGRYLDAIQVDPMTSGSLRQRTQALLGVVHAAGEAVTPSPPAATTPPAPPADASAAPSAPVVSPAR